MKKHIKGNNTDSILVIDDDDAVCRLIKIILVKNNYHVETFTDSREAIERFREYPFDMVITDLEMPYLSGLDVAQRVREKNASIPVILVSGALANQDAKNLKKFGINNMITKPLSINKFLEVVTMTLGSSMPH